MNITTKAIRQRNLERLIRDSGLRKGRFAEKVQTAPAYISQMLNKKNPRGMGADVARKIEAAFGKPLGWMDVLHENAEKLTFNQAETEKAEANARFFGFFETWDQDTPLRDDETALTFFKEAALAAGPGRTEVVEVSHYKLRFAKSTLKKMGVQEEAAYCVTVAGTSMEPVLPDGATLGVDTYRTAVKDGDIYAIEHAGELRVKLLYKTPGGGLRIRSYNSEEWPDEYLSREQAENVRVLGRVFWCSFLR